MGHRHHICDTIEFACISLNDNIWSGVLLVLGLLVFSQSISRGIEYVQEHSGHMTRVVLPIILEEVTILGLFSFSLFMLQYFSTFSDDFATYVDFFHISLFMTLIFYLAFIGFICMGRIWHLTEWNKYDDEIIAAGSSEQQIVDYEQQLSFLGKRNFVLFRTMRTHMIKYHSLPPEFRYSLYLEYVVNYLFEKAVRVGWKTGAVMINWLIFIKIVHDITDPAETEEESPQNNEYIFPASLLFNLISACFGLFCLIKIRRFIALIQRNRTESRVFAESPKAMSRIDSSPSPISEFKVDEDIFREEHKLVHKIYDSFSGIGSAKGKEWYIRYLPIIFESDPYISMFPGRNPDSFINVLQFFLLSQGLTWTVFFFIIIFLDSVYAPYGFIAFLVPAIIGIAVFPMVLPKYALLRYSGPLSNRILLKLIMNHKVCSEFITQS